MNNINSEKEKEKEDIIAFIKANKSHLPLLYSKLSFIDKEEKEDEIEKIQISILENEDYPQTGYTKPISKIML